MHKQLASYIKQEQLFQANDKVLLTVSGGVDSVVLCRLFKEAGFSFGIAHCNFQLRAQESNDDELFVKRLADRYQVPFHNIRFDTAAYMKEKKLSVQLAARELRYNWFEKTREQYHYTHIATAHHQDDLIETFFINLIRGSGIAGLRSILPKQGNIIRPLLFTNKNEIISYASNHQIAFREDSSNASDNYLRNKIRHHLMPVIESVNPAANTCITRSIEHLRETEIIYKKHIDTVRSTLCTKKKGSIAISISELKKLSPRSTYLFEIIRPYGFNRSQTKETDALLDAQAGKKIVSATHQLVKSKDCLILSPLIKSADPAIVYIVNEDQKELQTEDAVFYFQKQHDLKTIAYTFSLESAQIDRDKLQFPLIIRRWKKGDWFQPLGMKGKKKLSDFFTDQKFSLHEKQNCWVVCSENNIVWIAGLRLDDRFKITPETKNTISITFINTA